MRILVSVAAVALLLACLPAIAQQGAFPGQGSKEVWLKANGLYDEGNKLYEVKKYAESIAKYQSAVALYPFDAHYYYNLGLALKKNGDFKAAADAFRKSLALNKSDWRSWKGLANALYKDGQYFQSADAFKSALKANPPSKELPDIKNGLAAALRLRAQSK